MSEFISTETKVYAIVVTYNRKDLLMECLEAIKAQTYKVSRIFIINNASTDGTESLLLESGYLNDQTVTYIKMDKNTGGAGGFYEGLKEGMKGDADWFWIMDDDTIPSAECLNYLLAADSTVKGSGGYDGKGAKREKSSFYASAVYGADGTGMNAPGINVDSKKNGGHYWYFHLTEGIISISTATFVSLLIRKDAVGKCGLPCKDYFLWGDDNEYTHRLTRFYGDAYFVGNSIVIHKRTINPNNDIEKETNESRIQLNTYKYRNESINTMLYSGKPGLYTFAKLCYAVVYYLRNCTSKLGRLRGRVKIKGYWLAIVQYKHFKKYIYSQIKDI